MRKKESLITGIIGTKRTLLVRYQIKAVLDGYPFGKYIIEKNLTIAILYDVRRENK